MRIVGTANRGMNALRASLSRRGLGYVVGLTVLIALLGAGGMLAFEPASEAEGGFASYADALWWTGMLLTTMGSEYWPKSPEGRILCFLLSLYGFAVFGYITASFASFFVERDAASPEADTASNGDLAALRAEIAALRAELAANEAGHPLRPGGLCRTCLGEVRSPRSLSFPKVKRGAQRQPQRHRDPPRAKGGGR